jgi:hypothetical protein
VKAGMIYKQPDFFSLRIAVALRRFGEPRSQFSRNSGLADFFMQQASAERQSLRGKIMRLFA